MTTPILLFVCFVFILILTNKQTTNKSILLLYINLSSTSSSDYNIMVFISCWIQKICFSWFFLKKEKNILAHIHYIRIINIYCYFFNYICHFNFDFWVESPPYSWNQGFPIVIAAETFFAPFFFFFSIFLIKVR